MSGVKFSLDLIDRASGPAGRIRTGLEKVEDALKRLKRIGAKANPLSGLDNTSSLFSKAGGMASRFGSMALGAVGGVASIVADLAQKIALVGAAFTAAAAAGAFFFTRAVVQAAAFRQSSERAFDVLFGKGRGTEVFEKAKRLSLAYGESLQTTVEGLRDLKAAGISEADGDKLFAGLQDLQAIGGKESTDVGRFLLALNQIKSNGKLAAEEMNQLGEASKLLNKGDLKQAIASRLNITLDEFNKRQQAGKISADDAIAGVIDTMKKVSGGKLGELAKKASTETFNGAMRALTNLPAIIFDDIAQQIDLKPLTGFINKLSVALKSPEAKALGVTLGKMTSEVLKAATAIGDSFGGALGDTFKQLFSKENQTTAVDIFKAIGKAVTESAPAVQKLFDGFKQGLNLEVVISAFERIKKSLDGLTPEERSTGLALLQASFQAIGYVVGTVANAIASLVAGAAFFAVGLAKVSSAAATLIGYLQQLLDKLSAIGTQMGALGGFSGLGAIGGVAADGARVAMGASDIAPAAAAVVKGGETKNTINDQRSVAVSVSASRTASELASIIQREIGKMSPVSF